MQEMNRDFTYYCLLDYKWVNENENFYVYIENGRIKFNTPKGGELQTCYNINADKRAVAGDGFFTITMMGMMGDIFEPCHSGELFRLSCAERFICDKEGNKIYGIDRIWYGKGRLHGDFTEIESEKKIYIDFVYEDEDKIKKCTDQNSWECTWCGEKNDGKFCTNCGKEKKSRRS